MIEGGAPHQYFIDSHPRYPRLPVDTPLSYPSMSEGDLETLVDVIRCTFGSVTAVNEVRDQVPKLIGLIQSCGGLSASQGIDDDSSLDLLLRLERLATKDQKIGRSVINELKCKLPTLDAFKWFPADM